MSDIGIGFYLGKRFPGAEGLPPSRTLELVSSHGLDGVSFHSPLVLSPMLDHGELREVKAQADDLELRLDVGLGLVNPFRFDANQAVAALGDGNYLVGMQRQVEACHAIGCSDLWVYPSGNRFDATPSWPTQLQAIEQFLVALARTARERGCRLNLENHEEITSFEVLRLVEAVGDDVLGVTLDVANSVIVGENPVAAAERLAPYVRQTHLEDFVLRSTPTHFERVERPCGAGVVDWPAVVATLEERAPCTMLTIEQHWGTFPPIRISNESWVDHYPDLTPDERADVIRLQTTVGRTPASTETRVVEPAPEIRISELTESAAYLRWLAAAPA